MILRARLGRLRVRCGLHASRGALCAWQGLPDGCGSAR